MSDVDSDCKCEKFAPLANINGHRAVCVNCGKIWKQDDAGVYVLTEDSPLDPKKLVTGATMYRIEGERDG
jgi:hypothetical protein